MKYIRTNNKGSATFLMVLLVIVLLTVSIGFNWLVKEYIKSAQAFQKKAEAMLKARSAYDTLIYLMLNGKFTQKEIILPQIEELPQIESIPLNGIEVPFLEDLIIKVQDSNGLLSVTTINTVALKRLLTYFEVDPQNADTFIDSLLDWIDQDDLTRLNGAEREWYSFQGLKYEPRNYPIQYKEELKLIRGMDAELYSKIEPYISILPATGFNPNTAPDPVLIAYLDIGNDTLNVLKEYIQTKPITSDAELFSLTGRRIVKDEGLYFFPSRYLEITVQAGESKPFYTIKAGIYLNENIYSPYSIIYWKEE
uniref:T2SS protein K first SAM-like domain-containing protein n=1 Tax=Thermodesulfobacterium geofontis TaxID=1295609 RepID=A0A7C4NUS1_9BACT